MVLQPSREPHDTKPRSPVCPELYKSLGDLPPVSLISKRLIRSACGCVSLVAAAAAATSCEGTAWADIRIVDGTGGEGQTLVTAFPPDDDCLRVSGRLTRRCMSASTSSSSESRALLGLRKPEGLSSAQPSFKCNTSASLRPKRPLRDQFFTSLYNSSLSHEGTSPSIGNVEDIIRRAKRPSKGSLSPFFARESFTTASIT